MPCASGVRRCCSAGLCCFGVDVQTLVRDDLGAVPKIFIWAENNHSILSIIERATSADWSKHLHDWHPTMPALAHRAAALAVSGLIVTAGAIVWWRKRPSSDWTIAAWLAIMILPLGVTWDHYFIFALPLALLAAFSPQAPRGLRALGLALLSLVMAILPVYDISNAQAVEYLAHPAGAPWLRALPMLLLSAKTISVSPSTCFIVTTRRSALANWRCS
jgi:hypothetical protein